MNSDSKKPILDETTVDKNPFHQFEKWYGEAYRISDEDASAMTLVTASGKQPNARIVYLRGSDKKGFWFFTNYNSRKGKELTENATACLLFFWPRLLRQVKMLGYVEKLSRKESDNYFSLRPRESQISAWASPQSKPIPNRETLNAWVDEYIRIFEGKKISRPAHWGGYRFVPVCFEFWYGRESRLHDRIKFTKQKSGKWKVERLSP